MRSLPSNLAITFAPRFGGGFELMREGDVNNVWRLLEQGLKCAPTKSGSTVHLRDSQPFSRFSTYVQHMPAIAEYLNSSGLVSRSTLRLREFAVSRTMMRMQFGTQRPDLMSHLVR